VAVGGLSVSSDRSEGASSALAALPPQAPRSRGALFRSGGGLVAIAIVGLFALVVSPLAGASRLVHG
jgi:hypothetical protein